MDFKRAKYQNIHCIGKKGTQNGSKMHFEWSRNRIATIQNRPTKWSSNEFYGRKCQKFCITHGAGQKYPTVLRAKGIKS